MNVYLAGPMRGYPQFNRAAFERWADRLRAKGHEVFSPLENSVKLFGRSVLDEANGDEERMGGDPMTISRAVFHIDLSWICSHADAGALLPGWEGSKGAFAEAAVARALPIIVRGVEEF
jgi:hypothetical protein